MSVGLVNSKKGVRLFRISHKVRPFSSFTIASALGPNLTLHPPTPSHAPSKKWPSYPISLANNKIISSWAQILKKSLLICFERCQGISYPNRKSTKELVNTLLMVIITPTIRDSLEDKSMLFTHFYLMVCVSSKSREHSYVEPTYFLSINWQ